MSITFQQGVEVARQLQLAGVLTAVPSRAEDGPTENALRVRRWRRLNKAKARKSTRLASRRLRRRRAGVPENVRPMKTACKLGLAWWAEMAAA